MEISELAEEIRKFRFSYLPNSVGVPGRGSKTPEFLFIGEAPGREENEQGKPFVGRSGQLLLKWINVWGLDKRKYAITNIVRCWPNENAETRPPTQQEIDACSDFLVREIQLLKPKKLVVLGSVSAKEVTDLGKSILKNAGTVVQSKEKYGSLPTLIIPHPSYYLRKNMEVDSVIDGAKVFFNTVKLNNDIKTKRKIVLDIETNAEVDVEKANIRLIGVRDLDKNATAFMKSASELQKYLDEEKITHIIGFNHIKYDEPILSRFGIDFSNLYNTDLYITVQNKKTSLGLEKLESFSLESVVDFLKLGEKIDFDYNILKKDNITDEEEVLIKQYLENDLIITQKLYEYVYNIYSVVEKYIDSIDAFSESYLMITEGRLAYKTICKAKKIPEKIVESRIDKPKVTGGFVAEPSSVVSRGNLYVIDVQSSYPHAMMMGNLHERIKENEEATSRIWQRNDMFPNLVGIYRADEMGPVALLIKEIYNKRIELKKAKNPGHLGLKILLNTYYGVLASDKFVGVSDTVSGGDVTYMGQTFVKYMRKRLTEHGFEVIYSDTDSVYFKDIQYSSKEQIQKIIRDIAIEIKGQAPFPQNTFDFPLEAEISYLEFFPNEEAGTFGKKNYLYVTKDQRLVIKGLPIIKRNSTEVAKMVVKKLRPEIIQNLDCRFSFVRLQEEVLEFLKDNITLCSKAFTVKDFSFYKKKGQIEAQISERYGKGVHRLIPNKKIGVGKGKKFCTFDDAKILTINDLDLELVWANLEPFTKERNDDAQKRIFSYGE